MLQNPVTQRTSSSSSSSNALGLLLPNMEGGTKEGTYFPPGPFFPLEEAAAAAAAEATFAQGRTMGVSLSPHHRSRHDNVLPPIDVVREGACWLTW